MRVTVNENPQPSDETHRLKGRHSEFGLQRVMFADHRSSPIADGFCEFLDRSELGDLPLSLSDRFRDFLKLFVRGRLSRRLQESPQRRSVPAG
jgi:hypothetical protein